MDNKFFGIGSTYRSTIPDAKRATGFGATQEPFEYINQALFELKTDHIIGTAAQLALGQCTCKYQSSDQTLRDSSGTEVTLTDGDRVYIIGLDTLTADFDLSAYDRLRVTVDPSISLGNGSQNLIFGDETRLDIFADSDANITLGTDTYGFVNGKVSAFAFQDLRMDTGKGIDFSGAGTSSEILDDYEEGNFSPSLVTAGGSVTVLNNYGNYTKVGNIVTVFAFISLSAVSTPTGVIRLTNLPFTVKSVSDDKMQCASWYSDNFSSGAAYSLMPYAEGGQTTVRIDYWNGDDVVSTGAALLRASSAFGITLTYQTV